MAASLKTTLLDAKQNFDNEKYAECIEVLQTAPASHKKSYDYFLLSGKALFRTGRLDKSEQAYERACALKPDATAAWLGLVEVHQATGSHDKLAECYKKLVTLTADQPQEKAFEYHAGQAAALRDGQKLPEARVSLRQSLDAAAWDDEQRAMLLGQLIRVLEAEGRGCDKEVEELVRLRSFSLPECADVYDRHVRDRLQGVHALATGSPERASAREQILLQLHAALKVTGEAHTCICASPLEAVLALSEEGSLNNAQDDSSASGSSSGAEPLYAETAARLADAFPSSRWAGPAQAAVMYAQMSSSPTKPSTHAERLHLLEVLQKGSLTTVESPSTCILTALLQLQTNQASKGMATAAKGAQELQAADYPLSCQAVRRLNLLAAQSALLCGQLLAAERFAEASLGEGSPGRSSDQVARQAAAVLADVQAARGNLQEAKAAWLSILGDETATEHWVHGGLGAVLLKLQDMQMVQGRESSAARRAFQKALQLDARQRIAGEGMLSMLPRAEALKLALGRFTGSLKAYEKALALDPTRLHSLVQSGLLHLSLVSLQPALEALQAAQAVSPGYPPAVIGYGSALLAAARFSLHIGCPGTAAAQLEEATVHVRKAEQVAAETAEEQSSSEGICKSTAAQP
ncbi:hypothetical protein WJX73_010920 [Symbiochloris irregularis]|uniref:Uncharacterized protein n=1 Tax=Symbiochloris irregularis TaxID=706552 RepID=A0AAW1PZP4_9CHLO